MQKKKNLKVEIEWKLLERIAEFYEFPTAVFLGNMKMFPKPPKTRNESWKIKAKKYDQIKEMIEELKSKIDDDISMIEESL